MDNYKPYELKIQAVKFTPPPYELATVRFEGEEYATMKYIQRPVLTHVKRIDANTYKVIATGEIKEYDTMSEKAKNAAKRSALNRTFAELRGLIRTNFVSEGREGDNAQLFITLTYSQNMQDEKRLQKDFKKFIDKLIYTYPEHMFAYIAVMEPQGRGAWHIHLMLKSLNQKWLWLEKEDISRLWGHGYTTTARLKSNDVGAYYTAYFTGLVAETHEDSTGESIFKSDEFIVQLDKLYCDVVADQNLAGSKMQQKGARLSLYPKGMRFYRTSQNITKPDKQTQYVFEIDYDKEYERIYDRSYEISKTHLIGEKTGEVETLNKIYHATYKRAKKEKEGE